MSLATPITLIDARSRYLHPAVTWARGSAKRLVNAAGTFVRWRDNAAPWAYDPTTGRCLGLSIEETRTNVLRNGAGAGATPGSGYSTNPGGLPPYWSWSTAPATRGITYDLATGTETGIDYLEFWFQGTPSSTGNMILFLDSLTNAPYTPGDMWSAPVYLRALSITGLTAFNFGISFRDAPSGTNPTSTVETNFLAPMASAATLRDGWSHVEGSDASVSAAYAIDRISIGVTSGVPVNARVRIGWAGQRKGSYPDSPIVTTITADTRQPDRPSVLLSDLPGFRADAFSIVSRVRRDFAYAAGSYGALWQIDDGTSSNRILCAMGSVVSLTIVAGGVTQAVIYGPATPVGVDTAIGAAVQAGNCGLVLAGGAEVKGAPAALPTGLTTLRIGNQPGAELGGLVTWMPVFPGRLSAAALQALTV